MIEKQYQFLVVLLIISAACTWCSYMVNQGIYLYSPISQRDGVQQSQIRPTMDFYQQGDINGYPRYGVRPTDVDNLQVFYNRVPKTGSETISSLAYQLSLKNLFMFKMSNVYDHFGPRPGNYQVELTRNISNLPRPLFYDQHVFFIDFNRYGWNQPIFINTMRDPLERLVSSFYWFRFNTDYIPDPKRRNMTFDECVEKNHGDCRDDAFYPARWFCGSDPVCWQKDEDALAQAKANVEKYYTVVGLTEELDKFVMVLEKLIPRLFDGATKLYKHNHKQLFEQTRTTKKDNISQTTVNIMKERLSLDYDFYYFIKQRFRNLEKMISTL